MKKLKLILCICTFSMGVQAQVPKIFTYSDTSGIKGYTPDGTHISKSLFDAPVGMCFDADGNLYVADASNAVIRKVDTFGIVTTVAGTPGIPGFGGDGGPALSALLNQPIEVAFDAAGNLYIAEYNNFRVRKVDKKTNIISTYAGSPGAKARGDGGPAVNAKINPVTSIVFDKADNLYINEAGISCIRIVTPAGIISTIAGDTTAVWSGPPAYGDGGPAVKARFSDSHTLSSDFNGSIYVSDQVEVKVRRISRGKNIFHYAGAGSYKGTLGDGGPAKLGFMVTADGICNDNAGNLFIAESSGCRIRMVNKSTGIITTVAGSGKWAYNGNGLDALMTNMSPKKMVFDKRHNILYYTDINRIRCVTGLPAFPDQDPNEKDEEDIALGVVDVSQSALSIFPNPVSDVLFLRNLSTPVSLIVTDLSGKQVLKPEPEKGSGAVDISALNPGVYLLLLTEKDGGKQTVLKFTKN